MFQNLQSVHPQCLFSLLTHLDHGVRFCSKSLQTIVVFLMKTLTPHQSHASLSLWKALKSITAQSRDASCVSWSVSQILTSDRWQQWLQRVEKKKKKRGQEQSGRWGGCGPIAGPMVTDSFRQTQSDTLEWRAKNKTVTLPPKRSEWSHCLPVLFKLCLTPASLWDSLSPDLHPALWYRVQVQSYAQIRFAIEVSNPNKTFARRFIYVPKK